jgi:FAD synthetase
MTSCLETLDTLCNMCDVLCLSTDSTANEDYRENNVETAEIDRSRLRGDYAGSSLDATLVEALRAIAETFDTYGFEHVAVSFNGGKDCNVMMHLVYLFVSKRFGVERMRALRCLTWRQSDAFSEVSENMALCERVYSLTVDYFDGSFKDGLQVAIDRFSVKAIIMGQRATDPFAPNAIFAPTSPGWPPMMRVNPVLHWSYADVWLFTRLERVPICDLYFVGFTSLGARDKTVPNPALQDAAVFLPAWKLQDASLERAGRLK